MWSDGQFVLSHGTNLSAGVAILFSPELNVNILSINELEKGLSYRGRVLIANHLKASTLWHMLMVLDPPRNIIEDIQKTLDKFSCSGQHWLKAAVLYLAHFPVCFHEKKRRLAGR